MEDLRRLEDFQKRYSDTELRQMLDDSKSKPFSYLQKVRLINQCRYYLKKEKDLELKKLYEHKENPMSGWEGAE